MICKQDDDSIMRNKHLKIESKSFNAKESVPPAIDVLHGFAMISH